jgi:hypothetical protein
MDKGTANLALTAVCAAASIACAVFGYPHWAEWRHKRKQQPRGTAVKTGSLFVLLGIASIGLLTASAVFLGEWLYLKFFPVHPTVSVLALATLLIFVIGAWWLLASNAGDVIDDSKTLRSQISTLDADVSKWKVEYQRKFLECEEKDRERAQLITIKDGDCKTLKTESDLRIAALVRDLRGKDEECNQKVNKLNEKYSQILKDRERLQQKAPTELTTSDPRVYVEVQQREDDLRNSRHTVFVLTNRGEGEARKIQVTLPLAVGAATFHEIDVLGAGVSIETSPRIDDARWVKDDLFDLLAKQPRNNGLDSEIVIPFTIGYEDFRGRRFTVSAVMSYFPLNDALKRHDMLMKNSPIMSVKHGECKVTM